MSLFPAYARTDSTPDPLGNVIECKNDEKKYTITEEDEVTLLATDRSDSGSSCESILSPAPRATSSAYYVDCERDVGNLRVSTLYRPGRPQYEVHVHSPLGMPPAPARRRAAPRYFERMLDATNAATAEAVQARAAQFQQLLIDRPQDEDLWIDYIGFLERFGKRSGDGGGAAFTAAEAACARCPDSAPLRTRRLRLAQQTLPVDQYIESLRECIKKAGGGGSAVGCSLWSALVEAVACSAALCSAPAVREAAAAAVAATRQYAPAYPHLLYVYGTFLRSAGLWEHLVLLLELVCAMNFPQAVEAPRMPPDAECSLQLAEDQLVKSGLPLSAVWGRVERLRAAAHWRPAPAAPHDPQRAPLPADVADLLLPVSEGAQLFALAVNALRLARVPLLPGSGWAPAALHGPAGAPAGLLWDVDDASALLPLLWEGLRGPRAAASPPPHTIAQLLALATRHPHYFNDEHGFLSWTRSLWNGACSWFTGRERDALLCWRLRWHAALLAVGLAPGEAARVRRECRSALRDAANPLPCAEFARVEALSAGIERALDVALTALRAAAAQDEPVHHRLYIARVTHEVCSGAAAGRWALVSAALAEPLPAGCASDLRAEPPPSLCERALLECERRCEELEAELLDNSAHEDVCSALLPARAEWAWARALLSSPERLARLRERLLCDAPAAAWAGARRRFHEEASAALVWAARAAGAPATAYARALLPHHPHNARLALEAGRAPAWAAAAEGSVSLAVPEHMSPVAALGALLPPLSSALSDDWSPQYARGACATIRRLTAEEVEAARAPLLWALRLEAEARAASPAAAAAALYRALDRAPHHKDLYVVGARAAPADAAALADLLLEKQLRLHALPDELLAL